jgi:hypothetical protein
MKRAVLIVGMLIFLFGAGAFGMSFVRTMHTTVDWYKQVFETMGIGGLIMLSSHYLDGIINFGKRVFVKDTKEISVSEVKNEPAKADDWSFLMVNYDHLGGLVDSNTLDQEGKDLCRKLQKKMLDLHYAKTIKNETATVPTTGK